MTWWLLQSIRLAAEKAALKELEGGVDWLRVSKWHATPDLHMFVDFEIDHGGTTYGFEMMYPSVFPDAPPMVFTSDRKRISWHQYGPDGELCLEHRPDNWRSSVTGADMVVSCHNLLAEEHPDSGRVVHAHSAHVASLGRDLRSKSCRFLLTDADVAALNRMDASVPQVFALRERNGESVLIASIASIGEKDSIAWTSDLVLPKGVADGSGHAVRIPEVENKSDIDVKEFGALLGAHGLDELRVALLDSSGSTHLLTGDGEDWQLIWIFGEAQDRKIITYTTVRMPPTERRTPDGFEILRERAVGIVGCGSLGSKIAASLCRSGVGRFLLIDEDLFFPGNVVRNELDLKHVGAHKAYALKGRLLELNPLADIKALRLSLGGQESASSMAGALEALGKCDLLIDATAVPLAFNLVASVSRREKKPIIWAQVFAGGIGGYVARARPDIDPVPIAARDQIEVWCEDQGVDWIRHDDTGRYDDVAADGRPMVADDAEVSIIASHATRFATDILARPERSIFPQSAYLIGFSSEWIFEEPFDTRPIDLRPDGTWGETLDPLTPQEIMQLLQEHLPSNEDKDAAAASE